MTLSATAAAHPNIAFIKYWGNTDHDLRLPANSSLSMNLAELETRTQVSFEKSLSGDRLNLNGEDITGQALTRISGLLDRVRDLGKIKHYARVISKNNFPAGAGIASAAAAFAALTTAAC